jgi:hypothetical protein
MELEMKTLHCATLALLAAVSASPAAAQDIRFSLGAGSYGVTHGFTDNYKDTEFGGLALTAGVAFTNHLGARVNLFSTEWDTSSELEASGFDVLVLAGTNMTALGLNLYASAGFYKEDWEQNGFEESFGGPQFGFGIGYNWEKVTADFGMNFRDTGDYAGVWVSNTGRRVSPDSVTSTTLSLSYRF